MARPNLRIVFGTDDGQTVLNSIDHTASLSPPKMTLPASDVFRWLADAVDHDRAWLQDFVDDEITMSSDLYDIIVAHRHFHQES